MYNISLVESLTVLGLTLTFYTFLANIIVQRKDLFSRVLFVALIVNIIYITNTGFQVLTNININQFLTNVTIIQNLAVSWFISGGIITFYFLNDVILDLEGKLSDKSKLDRSNASKNNKPKFRLAKIPIYILVFLLFYYEFKYQGVSEYFYIIYIFFASILVLIIFAKIGKKTSKVDELKDSDTKTLQKNPNPLKLWWNKSFERKWWNERDKKTKLGFFIVTLVFILIIGFYMYGILFEEITYLNIDAVSGTNEYGPVYINNNATEYVVKGVTEEGAAVSVLSDRLNITERPVYSNSDGKFEYKVAIPKNVNQARVLVYSWKEGKKLNDRVVDIIRDSRGLTKSQYKASCQPINFKELEKYPNKYIGEHVKYTGKVDEIIEYTNEGNYQEEKAMYTSVDPSYRYTRMILYVNNNPDDKAYIYGGSTPVLEGSTITVYGEVYGKVNEKFEEKDPIVCPGINVKYIEIK